MRTPHVLHVSQPVSEGVARWVVHLVRDQVARGWDVSVACPTEGWLSTAVTEQGARHLAWEATRSPGPSVLTETLALRAILRERAPQLVHLHSSKAGLAGRLALRGSCRTLFQPHGWSFLATNGPVTRATRGWERFAARWADTIICVSEAEREDGITSGLPADRMIVIPNGIDLGAWPLGTGDERAAARRRLSLPVDDPIAVNVGRLARQKGQDLLLRAWPGVKAAVPDGRLYLVGDGPDRSELEAAAHGLEDAVVVGASSDVRSWLAAADVVVLPSRWEGMALTALEAAAAGRSIIATNAAGMREVVGGGDGAGGVILLADNEDHLVGELAKAVARRLGDRHLADSEGAHGRRNVEERFTLERAQEATAALVLPEAAGSAPVRTPAG